MPEFSLAEYGVPHRLIKLMGDPAIISVLCAHLALQDAGLAALSDDLPERTTGLEESGVIIGIGIGSLQSSYSSYLAHLGIQADDSRNQKKSQFDRMIIPMVMPNSAAAWVAILFGMHGTDYTLNAACASGTYAIGEAYQKVAEGLCPLILAGGVEALKEEHGAIMRGFDVLSTLTSAEDGVPMPFSEKRSGFLFSEGGGCLLVLEELEHALARGADIYAEIVGYESNCDARHIVLPEQSGQWIRQLLAKLIGNRKIDYFNSHGTATVVNDAIEARILQELFGPNSRQPTINASKGILGHSIGASGALEAAVTALSIKSGIVHGNFIPDPIADLNLATGKKAVAIDFAVSTSYGFGGHNGALLMRRYE